MWEKVKAVLGKLSGHLDRVLDDVGALFNSDIGVNPAWVGLALLLLIYFRLGAIKRGLRR